MSTGKARNLVSLSHALRDFEVSRLIFLLFPLRTVMAAGGVPTLGGYEYEFVEDIPDDWECLVCQLPLKDPIQIEGCGHRLCEICVGTILRYGIGCVSCAHVRFTRSFLKQVSLNL